MRDLRGKVAVVTGAASGIGYAMSARFAGEGMRVVMADVDAAALDAACREVLELGGDASSLPVDVSKPHDVRGLAGFVQRRYGAVHVLCNNAGVGIGGAVWEHGPEDWQWLLGVNVLGVVNGLREFVPMMLKQEGECHIVNTASAAGLDARAWLGLYSATKYAVVAISEALLADLQLRGASIGVSVLCPSLVNTRIADSERHRPQELAATRVELGADARAFDQAFRAALSQGLAPERVADAVIAAIRENRFYILPGPETAARVRARYERILQDASAGAAQAKGRWQR